MWRVYYTNGEIVTGEGDPAKLQPYGVIAILHGKTIEHGYDWYLWKLDMGWVGIKGDPSLILQFMMHAQEIIVCLAGESVPNEQYGRILARAINDQQEACGD